MQGAFPRPKIVISRCLEFDHCRYNGDMIASEAVRALKPFVEFTPICPEVECGLGVPREPVRIIRDGGTLRLIQHTTLRDVSDDMRRFAAGFLDGLGDVDGFILKSGSPSCGTKGVRIYASIEPGAAVGRGQGFFAGAVLDRFGNLAVEDEARLRNDRIQRHFFTRIFTSARFRRATRTGSYADLVGFHTQNKFLLMAYSETQMRLLGNIVANHDRLPAEEVIAAYRKGLYEALSRGPRYTAEINALMHTFGYISDRLSPEERRFFISSLEGYREGRVYFGSLVTLMREWMLRFDTGYLKEQTFFSPYPEELNALAIGRPGDQRDLWKG